MTNYSIAGQQLTQAVEAVIIAPGAEHKYGYAVMSGTHDAPELSVYTFDTRAEMDRALSDAFHGKLLSEIYHTVYRFGPDQPLDMYAVIEHDDDEVTP